MGRQELQAVIARLDAVMQTARMKEAVDRQEKAVLLVIIRSVFSRCAYVLLDHCVNGFGIFSGRLLLAFSRCNVLSLL